MNFKLKCATQWVASAFPRPNSVNRLLQLYISRSLPISDAALDARREIAAKHLQRYYDRNGHWPETVLDIGSGSDLAFPLLLASAGAVVTASDISRLATPGLIGDMLKRTGHSSLASAGVEYVIYSPPFLPLADQSFDLITSTSVLEHVPRNQLPPLFSELRRLLKPNGVASHHIAHKDHWSDADASLHEMNYLRYSNRKWTVFNPPVMFQNRVLHSQYRAMLENADFEFDAETTTINSVPDRVDIVFAGLPRSDLMTTHSWFTCWATKAGPSR